MSLTGYSTHADRDGLVHFALGGHSPARKVVLVHGEAGAKRALLGAIKQACLPQGQEVKVVIR